MADGTIVPDGWAHPDVDLANTKAALMRQNHNLLCIRASYLESGNRKAAMAVNDARNSIARALHELQRCGHEWDRAAIPRLRRVSPPTTS